MTTTILDALSERLARRASDLVIQPAAVGPWTAYYVQRYLVVLARPAAAGPTGAVDVAFMPLDSAGIIRSVADLEGPWFSAALDNAVRLAPTMPSRSAADFSGPTGWPLVDGILLILMAASWVARRRAESEYARATGAEEGQAVLRAARREANVRANSLVLGCAATLGVAFVATVGVVAVAALLVSAGLPPGLALPLWVVVVIAPSVVFWRIRRRWPSAPQRPIDRLGLYLVGLIIVLGVGVVLFSILGGQR